jgi:DNA-binding transcriptional MerR regulator
LDGSSSAAGFVPRSGSRPRPPKLYRIGEVVSYSGVSRQTVHNYTIMGLLHEAQWTEGGHRLYDESVFARLDLVVELKSQGKSLVEIRECCSRLDEQDAASQKK